MDLKFLYDSYIIASLMPRNKAIHYNLAMNMRSSIKKRQFNNSNASTSCQSLIIIQEKISMANVHIFPYSTTMKGYLFDFTCNFHVKSHNFHV